MRRSLPLLAMPLRSAARRAHTVGVLVPDGHPAWPPQLPAGAAEPTFVKGPTAADLRRQTDALDALVWVPGVAASEVVLSPLEQLRQHIDTSWPYLHATRTSLLKTLLTRIRSHSYRTIGLSSCERVEGRRRQHTRSCPKASCFCQV